MVVGNVCIFWSNLFTEAENRVITHAKINAGVGYEQILSLID